MKWTAIAESLRYTALRYNKNTDRQNSEAISRPVSPRFSDRCLLQPEQITVLDESEMITTQMESTTDQKMVAVTWDALYDTTL
jgi:hypothetical protein